MNHPSAEDEPVFNEVSQRFLIWQLELGEQDTFHIQGYVYFREAQRFNTVKALYPRAHIEAARGDPASNKAYCSKVCLTFQLFA